MASGTAPPGQRMRKPRTTDRPRSIDDPVVMMPRTFGGAELVVEDHGDHIAIVFPGALRLVGTRDEAVALAAALLHTVERRR
ncbi:MAG: hypothetical protein HS111_11845 [Kofleriaceae bacterium]|nr:hypothetical protein [Kofleriaceae bacterium]MCL4227331.1 hypothetical protein [Myxococcales bacterium]